MELGQRLVESVEAQRIEHLGHESGVVTISVGG